MKVYVESNFVLELALRQEAHEACERTLSFAEAGRIELIIPAWSLAEPYETWHRRAGEREELRDRLDDVLSQLSRTSDYAEVIEGSSGIVGLLSRSVDRDKKCLDRVCERLVEACSVVSLDADVLASSYDHQSAKDLSPQDALVFASVLVHLREHPPEEPKIVVTRDRDDFLTPEIQGDLNELGATLIPSLAGAADHLQNRLSD